MSSQYIAGMVNVDIQWNHLRTTKRRFLVRRRLSIPNWNSLPRGSEVSRVNAGSMVKLLGKDRDQAVDARPVIQFGCA